MSNYTVLTRNCITILLPILLACSEVTYSFGLSSPYGRLTAIGVILTLPFVTFGMYMVFAGLDHNAERKDVVNDYKYLVEITRCYAQWLTLRIASLRMNALLVSGTLMVFQKVVLKLGCDRHDNRTRDRLWYYPWPPAGAVSGEDRDFGRVEAARVLANRTLDHAYHRTTGPNRLLLGGVASSGT